MAEQKLNVTTSNGLYHADRIQSAVLSSSTQTADFCVDLRDTKAGVIAIIDIPPALGGVFELIVKSADGSANKAIKFNRFITRFDTLGVKDNDGFGHFTFKAESDGSVSDIGPIVTIINCIDVVNH